MSPPASFPAVAFLHSAPAPKIPSAPFRFADLPLDLFVLILDFLSSRDLARFARVAKFHNTIITPKLYKDVRIELIPDYSKGGKPLFVQTVKNCLLALVRNNAKYVESFAFRIDGGLLRVHDITDYDDDLVAESAFMVPLTLAVENMPRLKSFTFHSVSLPDYNLLKALQSRPCLEHLQLQFCGSWECDRELKDVDISGFKNLKTLHVHGLIRQYIANQLRIIADSCPQLEHLNIGYQVDYQEFWSTPHDDSSSFCLCPPVFEVIWAEKPDPRYRDYDPYKEYEVMGDHWADCDFPDDTTTKMVERPHLKSFSVANIFYGWDDFGPLWRRVFTDTPISNLTCLTLYNIIDQNGEARGTFTPDFSDEESESFDSYDSYSTHDSVYNGYLGHGYDNEYDYEYGFYGGYGNYDSPESDDSDSDKSIDSVFSSMERDIFDGLSQLITLDTEASRRMITSNNRLILFFYEAVRSGRLRLRQLRIKCDKWVPFVPVLKEIDSLELLHLETLTTPGLMYHHLIPAIAKNQDLKELRCETFKPGRKSDGPRPYLDRSPKEEKLSNKELNLMLNSFPNMQKLCLDANWSEAQWRKVCTVLPTRFPDLTAIRINSFIDWSKVSMEDIFDPDLASRCIKDPGAEKRALRLVNSYSERALRQGTEYKLRWVVIRRSWYHTERRLVEAGPDEVQQDSAMDKEKRDDENIEGGEAENNTPTVDTTGATTPAPEMDLDHPHPIKTILEAPPSSNTRRSLHPHNTLNGPSTRSTGTSTTTTTTTTKNPLAVAMSPRAKRALSYLKPPAKRKKRLSPIQLQKQKALEIEGLIKKRGWETVMWQVPEKHAAKLAKGIGMDCVREMIETYDGNSLLRFAEEEPERELW